MSDVFSLQVPLDASSVKGFKPDRTVKVIAYGGLEPTVEQMVKLDERGKGSAKFSFKQHPGSLKVALGPDNATSTDLQHMQTISTNVPASAWQGKSSLTVPAGFANTHVSIAALSAPFDKLKSSVPPPVLPAGAR